MPNRARFLEEVRFLESVADEKLCASCAATWWLKKYLSRLGPQLIKQKEAVFIGVLGGSLVECPVCAVREEYRRLCATSNDCRCDINGHGAAEGGDLRPNSFGNYLGRFVAEWIRRGWSTYGALLTGVQDGAWKLYQIRYYSPWSALYHGR